MGNDMRSSILNLLTSGLISGLIFSFIVAPPPATGTMLSFTETAVDDGAAAVREDDTELEAAQRGCMTLDQAVEQVRRQYNGRIVSAVTRLQGKREVHVIKVLTEDGTVRTVNVPGCTRN